MTLLFQAVLIYQNWAIIGSVAGVIIEGEGEMKGGTATATSLTYSSSLPSPPLPDYFVAVR